MNAVRFRLNISPQEALKYYRGQATTVIVQAENGQTIQFPALHIRPFIGADGVKGRFKIEFDQNHKFKSIQRI